MGTFKQINIRLPLTCQVDIPEQMYITWTISQRHFEIILGWVFGKMLLLREV